MAVDGEHEARARNERWRDRKARRNTDTGEQQRAGGHLDKSQPEDLPAHAPESRRLHLQPDDEQEHDHAELGDLQDGGGI